MTPPGESDLRRAYESVRDEQLVEQPRSNADVLMDLRIDLAEWRLMSDSVLEQITDKNEQLRSDIEAHGANVVTQNLLDAVAIGFRIGAAFGARQ